MLLKEQLWNDGFHARAAILRILAPEEPPIVKLQTLLHLE